jgi:hypothetical protein
MAGSVGATMLTILASVTILFFATIALLFDLQLPLFFAMLTGTVFFGLMLVRQFRALPAFNPVRMIAIGTGLFYFGGAMLVVGSQILFGDSPYGHIFERWRNYDIGPMVGATALAFCCSLVAINASNYINFRRLSSFVSPEIFYEGNSSAVFRDQAVALGLCTASGIFCVWLIASGVLKPQGAADLYDIRKIAGNEFTVVASTLIPASFLLIIYQIMSRETSFSTKMLVALSAVPVSLATLMLGRRYIIAALLIVALTAVAYRGARMKARHWAMAGASALVLFFAISGPFLAFRQAKLGNSEIGVDQLFTAAVSGNVLGLRNLSLPDLIALSAARSDLMGELAQITSRTPLSELHFGGGLLSQTAMLVPNYFWPGKARFIAYKMYNDFRVCSGAGLPANDLAGTLVLYSFGEVGWFAPIWYTTVAIIFVLLCDILVGIFRSFSLYLMTMSLLFVFAVVADNDWGGEILGEIRFILAAGLGIAVAKIFISVPNRYGASAYMDHQPREWPSRAASPKNDGSTSSAL